MVGRKSAARPGRAGLIAFGALAATPAAAAAPSLIAFGAVFPARILADRRRRRRSRRRGAGEVKLDEFLRVKLIVRLAFAILIAIGVRRLWRAGAPAVAATQRLEFKNGYGPS